MELGTPRYRVVSECVSVRVGGVCAFLVGETTTSQYMLPLRCHYAAKSNCQQHQRPVDR